MTDTILEFARAILIGVTLLILLRGKKAREISNVKGWKTILVGFLLIFFGTIIDITDNYPALNQFIVIGETPTQAFLEKVVGYLLGFMLLTIGIARWIPEIAEHQAAITRDLEITKDKVETLHGLLPICSACKKVRDDKGYWNQIETYVSKNSQAEFSHSICPTCSENLYPEYFAKMETSPKQPTPSNDA